MRAPNRLPSVLLTLALLLPSTLAAQASTYTAFGVGLVTPTGDFGEAYDPGIAARAQVGVDVMSMVSIHGQVGLNTFDGIDTSNDRGKVEVKGESVFHAAAGARVSSGLVFAGASAGLFFEGGDTDTGLVPEVGIRFMMFEASIDTKVTGERRWWSIRGAVRF